MEKKQSSFLSPDIYEMPYRDHHLWIVLPNSNDMANPILPAGELGSGCQLYYVPSKNIYIFLAINIGTVTESPILDKAACFVENIHKAILK